MHNRTSIWCKLRKLYVIIMLFTIFSAIMVTGCGSDGEKSRRGTQTSLIKCDNCAELVVTLAKQTYTRQEPITVTVKIMILDDAHLTIASQDSPMKNFKINVVDEQGISIPLTEEGIEARHSDSFRITDTITRGRPFEQSFQINPWFELSKPGTYTLTITKLAWDEYKDEYEKLEIAGDPIVFTRLP